MREFQKYLWKYKRLVENFLEETDFSDKEELITDFEDLFMFRFGLSGKEVEELDRKYLPKIYETAVENYPELKSWIDKSLQTAGVDLSIFQKTPV